MLDKNPETRITVPEIKVSDKRYAQDQLVVVLRRDCCMLVFVAAPCLVDRERHQSSSPGGGALHSSGGHRGGGAEQRQTHHQPFHCGEPHAALTDSKDPFFTTELLLTSGADFVYTKSDLWAANINVTSDCG